MRRYIVAYDVEEPDDRREYHRRNNAITEALDALEGTHLQGSVWLVEAGRRADILTVLSHAMEKKDRLVIARIGRNPLIYNPLAPDEA